MVLTGSELILQELIDKGVLLLNPINQKLSVNPLLDLSLSEVSLGFENVAIRQKKNKCTSRLAVNIESEVIRGVKRPIPLIAANMSTVCNADFCIKLYFAGALGVLHRAAPTEFLVEEVKKISQECEWVAASIGVGDDQFELAKKLVNAGANILFIDIAHGYSDAVIEMGQKLSSKLPAKIVLGNTTNVGLLLETAKFASAIKVGIAQGAACETKNTAGCTEKQFSAVYKFKKLAKETGVPIISDGGVREPADVVKAIGAGANSVMAGKIFAACPESAAEIIQLTDGKSYKIYAGMASRWVQNRWKGGLKDGTCPEGGVRYLELGESVDKLLERYGGALRSGITYAGGIDVASFQQAVEFIRLA